MPLKKNRSDAIVRAESRVASLSSINKNLDLGNGLTISAYRDSIGGAKTALEVYNSKVSELAALRTDLGKQEEDLNDLTSRMLAAVAVKFSKESDEYQQAGGTRKSARKSPTRKKKVLTPA